MSKRTVAQRLSKYLDVDTETVALWLDHRQIHNPSTCWHWSGRSKNTPGKIYKSRRKTLSARTIFARGKTSFQPQITIHGQNLNVRRLLYGLDRLRPRDRIHLTCGTPNCVNPHHFHIQQSGNRPEDRLPDDIDDLADDLTEIYDHEFERLEDLIQYAEDVHNLAEYTPAEYREAIRRNRRKFAKWKNLI